MYVQCSSHGNHSLIEVAHSIEDIGQAHKADVSSFVGGIVYGSAQTLNCVGRVTYHPPVERGNVEENPVRTILYIVWYAYVKSITVESE